MLFILSLICTFGSFIVSFIINVVNGTNIVLAFLYGICWFLGFLAFYSVIILLLLLILWNIYAKKPKPFSRFRWLLTVDIAMYSVYWLHIRVKANGLDKLPKEKPFIMYCNHQNFMDMFILYQVFRKYPHSTLFKDEILKYPLVRGVALGMGGTPINRHNDREALKSILETIKKVNNGQTFLIFPEGTRTKNTELNEYKPGSFKIAQKTNVPVVILSIDNAYKITKNMVIRRIPVEVTVIDVIYPDKFPETTVEFAKIVEDKTNEYIQSQRMTKKYLKVPEKYKQKL